MTASDTVITSQSFANFLSKMRIHLVHIDKKFGYWPMDYECVCYVGPGSSEGDSVNDQ